MFYKIAKWLSRTAIIFGFACMVGGCSEKSLELLILYEVLGISVFTAGAYALEWFRYQERQHRKRKIREAREHARREAA